MNRDVNAPQAVLLQLFGVAPIHRSDNRKEEENGQDINSRG
jgi:hypothetical protein